MKTIEEIKKEIAEECGEKHFDILVETEMSVGDYEQAKKLLMELENRFIDQFKKKEVIINAEIDKWLEETDFGYEASHIYRRHGAIMAIRWMKNKFLIQNKNDKDI
jgi:hypothetical protein